MGQIGNNIKNFGIKENEKKQQSKYGTPLRSCLKGNLQL